MTYDWQFCALRQSTSSELTWLIQLLFPTIATRWRPRECRRRQNWIINMWWYKSLLCKECNHRSRLIREAIWIRKRAPHTMNRDEGPHFLSHIYDPLLTSSTSWPHLMVIIGNRSWINQVNSDEVLYPRARNYQS